MERILLPVFFLLSITLPAFSQKGHNLTVKLENYDFPQLILGFHYGEKQYIKDTADIDKDGFFRFKADTLLPEGVYLLVMKPDNAFIQILMTKSNQTFTLQTDVKDQVGKMKIKGSPDNEVFYKYLKVINDARPEADTLRARLGRIKNNPADSVALATKLQDIDKSIKDYQINMVRKNPGFLSSRVVSASLEPEIPLFEGPEKEVQLKRYAYYRSHYFDNVDMADPALLRSPVLHGKMDAFITKITPQHPDTINKALDFIYSKIQKNEEVFKYFLIHFLNLYAKSNIVGFDACYVHIAKNYYCVGMAPWSKKEDIEKICDNANRLDPILIGKTAPNIVVKDRNGSPVNMYQTDADYTVLFFWDPECSHCKKSAPFMVEFAEKFKNRGVSVFAVCTAIGEKAGDCWKSVDEKGFNDMLINTYDPMLASRFKTLYDIRTTPQIFILNRKHEILMKRIGAEELSKVMEQVIQFQQERK
jgi:thiol-disulfide isomerase/thioredoxin